MPEKFIVPQFIDNEDQILGPITVRQFLIVLVTLFTTFIAFKILALPYFIAYAIFALGIGGTFGFLKVNGQPFHIFFLNAAQTLSRPGLRTWDKRPLDNELKAFINSNQVAPPMAVSAQKPRPESSRLRDLTLVVNTGGVYKPEDENF